VADYCYKQVNNTCGIANKISLKLPKIHNGVIAGAGAEVTLASHPWITLDNTDATKPSIFTFKPNNKSLVLEHLFFVVQENTAS
jgi:hypothetical protein